MYPPRDLRFVAIFSCTLTQVDELERLTTL
jgi:hypothetical protein